MQSSGVPDRHIRSTLALGLNSNYFTLASVLITDGRTRVKQYYKIFITSFNFFYFPFSNPFKIML